MSEGTACTEGKLIVVFLQQYAPSLRQVPTSLNSFEPYKLSLTWSLLLHREPPMSSSSHAFASDLKPPPSCLHPLHVLDHYLVSVDSKKKNDDEEEATEMKQSHHRDEILQVVDFLYGNTLEGALHILDDAESIIRRIVSHSRSLYLVKSSSSSSRGKEDPSSYYLCILPDEGCSHPIYYCSCRSFLERSRSTGTCLCKHLLALRLMPVLQVQCTTVETVSDEEFANLVLQRMSIH